MRLILNTAINDQTQGRANLKTTCLTETFSPCKIKMIRMTEAGSRQCELKQTPASDVSSPVSLASLSPAEVLLQTVLAG